MPGNPWCATLNGSVVGSRAASASRAAEGMRWRQEGWRDGQMEQAYGRCDAIRMQDASGEISGRDSYVHEKVILPPLPLPHKPNLLLFFHRPAWVCESVDRVRLTRRTRQARHFVCTEGRLSVLPVQAEESGVRARRVFFFFFLPPASARIKIILGNFWGFWKRDNNYRTLLFIFQCVRTFKAAARGNLLLLAYNCLFFF